ncbi:MAG: von Willebrand factor, type A, partial [Methanocalculus sp. 52_23]
SEVTAGETTPITVRMVDRYGNAVDNRSATETVNFMVGSPEDGLGAVFIGGTDEISVPVDAAGNATATLRVDTVAGEHLVFIQPPAPVRSDYISITGVADGVPAGITCTVSPSGASVPANGKDQITLMYTLIDEYGNSAEGQGLWVNSSGLQGQSKCFNSSSCGEVWVTYGPEETVGVATITATAVANSSVTNTAQVEFTSTEPVKMVVSASPQTMASRDCNPNVVSELRARVMDVKGNPVDNEKVTFTIDNSSITVSGSTPTGNPYLGEVEGELMAEAETINGSATVKFHPGSFAPPEEGEKATAKGNVTVLATWDDVSRPIELIWVNYPYLSVETEVSNPKVSVNSTEEDATNTTYVTIRLKGDGYAMQPDPIDVVLCTDRSGSMLYDNPDRMHSVREAAKLFVDNMSERDRVGLVTFGRNTGSSNQINVPGEFSFNYPQYYINNQYETPKQYLDYATVDLPLNDTFSSVKTELDKIVPDHGTPMRAGLYKSIKELCGSGSSTTNSDAIKAVILLSDGDYNWYGDPLAEGTGYSSSEYGPTAYGDLTSNYYIFSDLLDPEQNLSVYAQHKNVTIYSIGYANSISKDGRDTLKKLAEFTGGKYYNGTAANIADIYTEIAGELKNEASVDTNMTVFENVEINNGTPIAAFEVFDYKHEPDKSTTIRSWVNNTTGDWLDLRFEIIDQTDAWKRDKQLYFDIGTIHLGQTWETTFCLAVNASYEAGEENNINIFGPGAVILFNNGTENLELPDTYVTVFPDLTNTGLTSSSLAVEFTEPGSGSGPYTDLVPLTWNATYKGTERVDVSLACSQYEDMRSPTHLLTRTLGPGGFATVDNTTTDSTLMDVKDLAPGQYWITVTAVARDAETAEDTINVWAHTKGAPRAYIKIE